MQKKKNEEDEELDDRLEKLIKQKTNETSALKNLLEELANSADNINMHNSNSETINEN